MIALCEIEEGKMREGIRRIGRTVKQVMIYDILDNYYIKHHDTTRYTTHDYTTKTMIIL